jgi:hypothetical protein
MSSAPRPLESPNPRQPNLFTRRSSSGSALGINMGELALPTSHLLSSWRDRMATKLRKCMAITSCPPTCCGLADAISVGTNYGVPVSVAQVSSARDANYPLSNTVRLDCHFACHSRCGVLVKGICRQTGAPDELAGEITAMRTSSISILQFHMLTRECSTVNVRA